jgi:hypothetical protein
VEIPKKDRDDFGDDLVEAVRRWARAEIEPTLAELRATVAELRTKADQLGTAQEKTVVLTGQQAVLAGLDRDPVLGATWRTTNDSPAFLAWLAEVDPFSGQQRLALLQGAFSAGNTPRVAAFFTAFAREHTGSQNPVTPTPQTPAPGAGGPSLTDLAAPGRASGSTPTGASQDKRIWTTAEIAAFYRDVNKGVYEGRDVDKARLEADIFAAPLEGRVR